MCSLWISPSLTLTGQLVRLEPLTLDHVDALREAVRDGELHTAWWTSTPSPDAMAADIRNKLALRDAGSMVPFACIRLVDGVTVGVTTYYDLSPEVPRLEIGYTWSRAPALIQTQNYYCSNTLSGNWGVSGWESAPNGQTTNPGPQSNDWG